MRVVCALSYSKVPHGSFIGFPWCSRVPKSKCGNNMKFVHVGNYRQRQGFDTRYFLHIASAMRVLTFCNTALDLIEKKMPLQFFVFHSCLLSWSLPSLPLPPCLPVLSPHSPSLPPHFKSDKKSSLFGVYIWAYAYAGVIYEYHANHPNLDKTNKICPRSTRPTAKS